MKSRFPSAAHVAPALVPAFVLLAFVGGGAAEEPQPFVAEPLPERLADTGLAIADDPREVDPAHIPFSPQYPLWSDGATKRRWISLPPGTAVDASDPDAFVFPRGTRLWKEFAVDGRPVETRLIEHLQDGSWRFSTYAWDADGRDAALVEDRGGVAVLARGGRYVLPSRADCRACHEGGAVPVLGFSALQLSGDRDPNAAHAEPPTVDLAALARRGVVRHLPQALLDVPPRIAAASPAERAALGYLHGNCANCHNGAEAGVPVGLDLQQRVAGPSPAVRALFADSRFRITGRPEATRWIEPGRPEASVLSLRMHARDPHRQMPPVGSQRVDALGVALIDDWIATLPPTKESAHAPGRR